MSSVIKIGFSLIFLGLLAAGYVLFEPYWLRINNVTLIHQDIPLAFDGMQIIFASDIHHGPYFSQARVKRVVETINHLTPDLVIFGGDYVHRDPQYIEPCFEELQHIQAPFGKFGVLGNHDHWESAVITRQQMQKAGITNLDNRSVWIVKEDARIKLGGVGDLWEDTQDLRPTLHDTTENNFVMLVSHNPDFAETLTMRQIDVMLSGHTHGGQITLFGRWAPLVPSRYGQKYRAGMVTTPFTTVLITHGVGTITPPVRFFARPEIVVLTLRMKRR
ncbi:metallophosphoesterase [Candidatus Vecturithrix granuli]|uniref:Metallophosphoesterase n=1 Tax=Vecturithrix granuli TaxID=1499967 RepID=A0A0S6W7I4_VECG1|nr:metallophosphoesterase [Candidatus Vecturithrix granuli]